MKRLFSLVLAFGILLGCATSAAAAAPGGQYAKAQEQDGAAAFLAGILCSFFEQVTPDETQKPEKTEEEKLLSLRAKCWGLPENIAWIENPQSEADIENNILFCFLKGEYAFRFENLTREQREQLFGQIRPDYGSGYIKKLACSYPELAGALANIWPGCGIGQNTNNANCYLFIDFPQLENTEITDALLYRQQLKALDAALEISRNLHEKGTIHDGMTQMQIAEVYYDYLCKSGVEVGKGAEVVETGGTALLDSAWACLVSKTADCVGRAAGFNLLMHIEGISAQGVRGRFTDSNSGHVLSRVILDGKEYFCDWGNHKKILPKKAFEEEYNFDFDTESLAYARAHGGNYEA